MANNYKPEGYQTVIPYITVEQPEKLIVFLTTTLNGNLTENILGKDGETMHAEVKIDDSAIMIGKARHGNSTTKSMQYVYVENVDEIYQTMLDNGAKSMEEPKDQFYGDRSAGVTGPCGNQWWIATSKASYSKEELQEKADNL